MNGRPLRTVQVATLGAAGVGCVAIVSALFSLNVAETLGLLCLVAIMAVAFDIRRRFGMLTARVAQQTDRVHALDARLDQSEQALAAIGQRLTSHALKLDDLSALGHQRAGDLGTILDSVVASRQAIATTLENVAESLRRGMPRLEGIQAIVRRESGILFRQLEALHRLDGVVDVSGMTPPLRGWAASPDVIALLVEELRRLRPITVVECGSGASTVWMAMAIRSARMSTKIVALEHEESFAAATNTLLTDCGVSSIAEVRFAPLLAVDHHGTELSWYDPGALAGLTDVGLVFVDGPPASSGPSARAPAMRMLRDTFAERVTIVLDDTIREDETAIAAEWTTEFPDFTRTDYNLEKGAAVLRRA